MIITAQCILFFTRMDTVIRCLLGLIHSFPILMLKILLNPLQNVDLL